MKEYLTELTTNLLYNMLDGAKITLRRYTLKKDESGIKEMTNLIALIRDELKIRKI